MRKFDVEEMVRQNIPFEERRMRMCSKEKDPTIIPRGSYCYKNDICCPYWDSNENESNQDNGYCHFLKIGDWENEYMGLLWDQVKECGINDEIDEELDIKE